MKMNNNWWKEGVVYQIYPRSFKDTTGNGLGDIDGIIEKLDYIKSLGVNMIWICPVYASPNDDNGYDISDYRKISEDFGGNEAFDRLLKAMHARDLKLIMDLVVNHSSDEHHWFEQAKQSKDNPYHDYYIWKEGTPTTIPNNWQSVFNGSVWEWNAPTKEYYLHYYTKKQPDLNWENPSVRKEVYAIIDFWLAKGVDGFRMDVISLISKRIAFENVPQSMSFIDVMEKVYANGPRVHEYLKEMNREVLSKYDAVTVGEGPGVNLEHGPRYVSTKEKELNMVFHFDHLTIDFGPEGKYDPVPVDFLRFKEIFSQWDQALAEDGWNSIFLGNHDFSRIVSRFGNDRKYHNASAKLLATLLMSLRGTPYVYQGDEIGMTNVAHPSIDLYDDVETRNAWKAAEAAGKDMNQFLKAVHWQSRDNARTPMQWDASMQAGFSTGKPWIPVNENHEQINVAAAENDPNSILHYYRKMIAYRKANPSLVYGHFEDLLPQHPYLFVYKRWDDKGTFLVGHNFRDENTNWEQKELGYKMDIGNYATPSSQFLSPWESRIYRLV
ncbi:MAG: alpha-glucosidase [Flavobacteriaceae bacterium]|nr:alpha-glucosidase [Flavobacteriaceae bacterium]